MQLISFLKQAPVARIEAFHSDSVRFAAEMQRSLDRLEVACGGKSSEVPAEAAEERQPAK